MKIKSPCFFVIILFLAFYSCLTPEEQLSNDPNIRLEFSNRVIVLDTLLNQIRNPSQRLQVYNPSQNAIKIDRIALRMKSNSPFSLIVNGQKGFEFSEVEILGGDSLLVVIETSFSNNLSNFQEQFDMIIFSTNGNTQEVPLLAWAEPVEVLKAEIINQDTDFEKGKSYLIQDSLIVNATLNIPDSVNVYFFNDAYLKVNGMLNVDGKAEKNVNFSFYRKEIEFENSTGTWQGILIEQNGKVNANFLDIKNAVNAFEVNGGGLSLKNVIIHYLSDYGILAQNGTLYSENSLIYNCGKRLIFSENGGNFQFVHSTLSHFNFNIIVESPALFFENQSDNALIISLKNTIIWVKETESILVTSVQNPSIISENNIIKTENSLFLQSNSFNQDPQFENQENDNFQLNFSSPAVNAGVDLGINTDIRGKNRDSSPDIGAYELIIE